MLGNCKLVRKPPGHHDPRAKTSPVAPGRVPYCRDAINKGRDCWAVKQEERVGLGPRKTRVGDPGGETTPLRRRLVDNYRTVPQKQI